MQKLQAEVSALTARATLLHTRRAAAQAASDRAVDARQRHMLEGDLDNEAVATKLQTAVDAAASVLAGFETPIATLAVSIADAEAKLGVEQLAADRKAGSARLALETDDFEQQLAPWLALTRSLAASAATVGSVHWEAAQIGAYLRNAASEIEVAVNVSVGNLRASVTNILAGHHPIPRAPVVAAPVATSPLPELVQVFCVHPITWIDHRGQQRRLGKWRDADLPPKLAAFALKSGVAAPLDDPRCKMRNQSPGHPEPHWCNDLDAETGPNIAVTQSARIDSAQPAPEPFIRRDRNTPFVIKHREAS